MISIVLIGTGNVARHLFDTFMLYSEIKVVQVMGRNKEELAYFGSYSKFTTNFDKPKPADVCILAVSDNAIPIISRSMTNYSGLVVHTSGSVPMDVLSDHDPKGVFYPLQTFSKNRKIDFKKVPICLEANRKEDFELLQHLAHLISDHVHEITSEQRKSLHLAAVFVNNFTNHLYQIGSSICGSNNIPFEILKPLIRETAAKIEELSPHDAQTGPARRGDIYTVKQHLGELKNDDFIQIYELMSRSIEKEYQGK